MQVPQKFYKTFKVAASAGSEAAFMESPGKRPSLKPQGEFSFHFDDLPAGTHTLEIVAIGLVFPQVSVRTGQEQKTKVGNC